VSFNLFSEETTNQVVKEFLKPLNSTISIFVNDYSKIVGLYSANQDVKGSASIGSFPSFRVGTNFGTIFLANPLRFLRSIDFGGMNYEKLTKLETLSSAKDAIDFFDKNFLPVPVTSYTFEIGLPKGFSVGSSFQIIPIGDFIRGVSPDTQNYLNGLTFWGLGANFNYTIMKEYRWLPSISVGSGFNYNSTNFDIKMPMGNLKIDASNDLKSELNFSSKSDISTFYFDFTVSKTFIFFQPFVNVKFTQSINHNITKFNLLIDMSNATQEAKDNYGGGKIGVNNISKKDQYGNEVGSIIPVSDFILSTGFEFVMGIYRMGFAGSYGLVSQTGMISLNIRFQLEKDNFKKKN